MKWAELNVLWKRYHYSSAALLAYANLEDAATPAADDKENEMVANIYHKGAEVLNKRLTIRLMHWDPFVAMIVLRKLDPISN